MQRAGVVEIDLVLQGKPTLTYSRDGLPEFDHAVSVTRATAPDRYEIYTATIQKRLPKFKLPLAPDDRDTLLDLQAAFARAYDLGGFAAQIDYKAPPAARRAAHRRLSGLDRRHAEADEGPLVLRPPASSLHRIAPGREFSRLCRNSVTNSGDSSRFFLPRSSRATRSELQS